MGRAPNDARLGWVGKLRRAGGVVRVVADGLGANGSGAARFGASGVSRLSRLSRDASARRFSTVARGCAACTTTTTNLRPGVR